MSFFGVHTYKVHGYICMELHYLFHCAMVMLNFSTNNSLKQKHKFIRKRL